MKNTLLSYMYRCGGNYKYAHEEVARGELTPQEMEEIAACDEFIAEELGMTAKQPEKYDDELDHPWHEFTDVETTEREPTITMSAKEILKKVRSGVWDESLSWIHQEQMEKF